MINKSSFRIGIDARMYGPKQTGIGAYIENLIDQLCQLDHTNDYYLFCLEDNFNLIKQLPTNFHKVKTHSHWYTIHEQVFLLKDIFRYQLDLMHFTHFNFPVFYPGKFIITIHDITPKLFPGNKMGKSPLRRKGYDFIVRKALQKSAAVITPSSKTKQDLIKFYGGNKNKIKVIYEGIKEKNHALLRKEFLDSYSQNKEVAFKEIQSKFNLKNLKKPYLFYVGVWREHKNLINLICAFEVLKKEYDFQGSLVLGGADEALYPEIKKEWQKRGLEGQILTTGFLSDEDLKLFYRGADVFVLPSFYEGFGLVTIEALNQGTAVACSDIEPLQEINRDAAMYFNPDEPQDIAGKINELLQDRRRQLALVKNAQKFLDEYCWTKMTQKTHRTYLQLARKD